MVLGGQTHRGMSGLSPRYGPDVKGHQKGCDSAAWDASARSSLIPVLQWLSLVSPEDTWKFLETFLLVTTDGGGDVL